MTSTTIAGSAAELSEAPRFAPRLLYKITLPYVALAIALALAVIYVVARMQAASIASDFARQLDETQLRVADSIVRAEQGQLADVRTLARLSGLGQAVRAGDRDAALALIAPYAMSQSIERVVVLGRDGRVLAGVQTSAGSLTYEANAAAPGWPFAAAVLSGAADGQGDKYAGIAEDRGAVLYTAAPLYDGQAQVGALLVGTTGRTLVERWRAETLADVSLYGPDGAVLASSFGTEAPPRLEAGTGEGQIARELSLGSRRYTESVAALVLRSGTAPQSVGVAISRAGQASLRYDAQVELLLILAAGIVAAILIGGLLSRRITRPITALVRAAEGVASGDLDQRVEVTTGDEIGALASSFNAMVEGLRERERMHDVLGRFVSPTVARLVLSRPLALSGESKRLSILFTDLRDFTAMTEREDPAAVIGGLNDYFQIVVEAADRYGGVVNKFGGDSTLVLFGLTDGAASERASAEAAVRAALDSRAGMEALNRRRAAEGLHTLSAGIGINTGDAIAGLIGAERRMEYTVIGDAVNLSARIQALNRELAGDILISDATYAALGKPDALRVEDHGVHHVKGKSSGVRVYAVISWEGSNAT
jgi:class 3 adenylate cyclase